ERRGGLRPAHAAACRVPGPPGLGVQAPYLAGRGGLVGGQGGKPGVVVAPGLVKGAGEDLGVLHQPPQLLDHERLDLLGGHAPNRAGALAALLRRLALVVAVSNLPLAGEDVPHDAVAAGTPEDALEERPVDVPYLGPRRPPVVREDLL